MDERDILNRLSQGREDAFEKVFKRYFVKLCLYAEHFIKDKSAAEEIVEDFFVCLWDNCTSLKIESNLPSYLFRAVHNRCLKYLRHENVKKKYAEMERGYLFYDREILEPVSEDIPEAFLICRELEDKIYEAISSLPDQCRKVFELSRFEDLSYKEISERMNISENTVKTHMSRALKSLRDTLKDFLFFASLFFVLSNFI